METIRKRLRVVTRADKERARLMAIITRSDYEGMLELAKTDDGMLELLEKAKVYFALHGSPRGPRLPARSRTELRRETETAAEYAQRMAANRSNEWR
jgi:hypothetical protein